MAIYHYYHKKYIWLTGFILWTLFILLATVIPDTGKVIQQKTENFRWDYLEHFIAYFVLGTLFILWRGDKNFSIRKTELIIIFATAGSYAILTEFLQLLIPGRAFNIIDILFNLTGVLCSIIFVYFYILHYYLKKKQSTITT